MQFDCFYLISVALRSELKKVRAARRGNNFRRRNMQHKRVIPWFAHPITVEYTSSVVNKREALNLENQIVKEENS